MADSKNSPKTLELIIKTSTQYVQMVFHRLPLLLPERDALIPLRHFSPDHSLARGFLLGKRE